MLLSSETAHISNELQSSLEALVPGIPLIQVRLVEDRLPATLMVSSHAVHAFAIGEEQDYVPLYEAFKKHYLNQGADWTVKDVSFVFCLPPEYQAPEAFPSKVEVDVYFCRKYVIKLGQDIDSSLARLPFLPLAPVSAKPIRPPSANTLLQQRSMKAELATNLVKQGTGAAAILANCLNGRYGSTHEIDERSAESTAVKSEQRDQTTLKSISIENFRAYRKKKDFEFGSAITVLYGPNGFGKTSLFDAVDFVVTGGIARFDRSSSGLSKVAKHLDGKDEPTQVALTVERAGKTHTIVRNLATPNDATLDGQDEQRRAILSFLTGGETVSSERVENLVSLFRATHLFSLDAQELTGSVSNSCTLPANIVSRMLAFDDYVNGFNKVNEVLKLAKQEFRRATDLANQAKEGVEKDTEEIKRLEGMLNAIASPQALDEKFNELEISITKAGFELTGLDLRDSRSLRAAFEALASGASTHTARLQSCLEHVANLRSLSGQQEPLRAQLEEVRGLTEKLNAESVEAAHRASAMMSELASIKAQIDEATNLKNALNWAVATNPESTRLTVELQKNSERLSGLLEFLEGQKEKIFHAAVAQGEAEVAVNTAAERLTIESDRRIRINQAASMVELTSSLPARLADAQSNEVLAQQDLNTQQEQLDKFRQLVLEQQNLVARISGQLDNAKNDVDKVKALIAELRSHISGSECLMCGHDHGSQEELLLAIDQRIQKTDYVVRVSESLTAEMDKLRALEQQLQAHQDTYTQTGLRLHSSRLLREELQSQMTECHKVFSAIELTVGDDLPRQLSEAITNAHINEQKAQEAAITARELLYKAQTRLAQLQQENEIVRSEEKSLSAFVTETKNQIDRLANDARNKGVSLSENPEDTLRSLHIQLEKLAHLNSRHLEISGNFENARTAQNIVTGRIGAAESALRDAIQSWNHHQEQVVRHATALAAEGFSGEVSEDEILEKMAAINANSHAALALRDQASEIEVATDAAATSAAFQSIRTRIELNEAIVKRAEEDAGLVGPWVKYFEGVSNLLSGQQALATAHFTSEYGPRTAVIQRRLRPVYGFQDVDVTSKDSTIEIHVRRNGEKLRPTDFFSQSQVQTLVLGLFLTACSSQTWSGFSSIMMDDPVAHFDDLNTYALLDLISGLQSSPDGNKQFVISTCDEKLLQLARHKFRHLEGAAKFYRFSAIGAEGPMVSEIPA